MKKIFQISLFVFLIGLCFAFIRLNVNVVIPGELYRSGQLPSFLTRYYIKIFHIKSIINLRGEVPDDWYQNEKSVAQQNQVALIDTTIVNAETMPKATDLLATINLLEHAPKPMWIHCEGGAERSGLAVALWLLTNSDWPLDKIEAQVSLQYQAIFPSAAGKLMLVQYENWLQKHHLQHSTAQFKQWLHEITD